MTTAGGVVALLFTDLVRSTELLDRIGDDAADEVRRHHFELLRQAVDEAGGEEVKNLGDGLMVSFASPVAAVGCALAMQRAVAGSGLELRVGLHAGEPVHELGDYFGTTVVVARRLCDHARGGQVLASDLLAGFVGTRGGFRFRPLGRLHLKGLSEPVAAVEVAQHDAAESSGPRATGWRPARAGRPRGPALVGRDREMAVLTSELDAAAAGELRCVLLSGEPGVGKTRLWTELLARRDDVVALTARGHPMGDTTAFGLWAEALDGYLRRLEPRDVSDLCGGYVEDLASLLRSVAAVRGSPPATPPSRSGLLEGITVVLDHLSERGPVVVVLDDVHQADGSSWDGVSYLARNLAGAPILVVLGARASELSVHPVANRVLLPLEQEGLLTRLAVGPLERAAIADLARTVLSRPPPAPLTAWLDERSQGNPLFALGLLRALLDEGADLGAPRLRRLPEDLAERVQGMLATLDEPALSTLELLAVVGRPAAIEELEALLAKDPDQLTTILGALGRARVVVEEEHGAHVAYGISHPLVQETIYASIGAPRRRVLHREVGRHLLRAGRPAESASHFARSASPGDVEAIEALRLALREAEDRRAYRETLGLLGVLVEVLPEGDERWLEVGAVLSGDVKWAENPNPHPADAELGIRALRAIDAALEGSPDLVRRGVVKLRMNNLLSWGTGDVAEAERVCRQAEALFARAGDRQHALLARHEVAWARGLGGDMAGLEREAAEVLEEARNAGDRLVELLALMPVAVAAMTQGRFDAAEQAARQSLALATTVVSRPPTAARTTLAHALALEGRVTEARRILEEVVTDDPRHRDAMFNEASTGVHAMAGDIPAALAAAEETIAWNAGKLTVRRASYLSFAVLAAIEGDRIDLARRYLELVGDVYAKVDWWHHRSLAAAVARRVDAWEDPSPHSIARFAEAVDHLVSTAPSFAAPLVLDVAEERARLPDPDAGSAARTLHELAERFDRDFHRALSRLAAGWAALAGSAPGTAAAHAREALDLLASFDLPLLEGRAHDLLGRALGATDPDAARDAFTRAVAAFESCGAAVRQGRAAEELRRLSRRGPG